MSFEDVNNVDDAFKQLDAKEFSFIAVALAGLRRSLMNEGFNRREAQRLVESYAKFIYDMALDEYLSRKAGEDDDVDPDEEIE